jgi:hypothetical protein
MGNDFRAFWRIGWQRGVHPLCAGHEDARGYFRRVWGPLWWRVRPC